MKIPCFDPTAVGALDTQESARFLQACLFRFSALCRMRTAFLAAMLLATSVSPASASKEINPYSFYDGGAAGDDYRLPEWFKDSFLDLREDLAEALENNKKGLLVYFGSRFCSYCKVLLEVNFRQPAIRSLIEENFDVIGLEVLSNAEITAFDGATLPIREFCKRERVRFTPTLVFYTPEGKQALKLEGYRPPDKFTAVLNYVIEGQYAQHSLRQYLAIKENAATTANTRSLQSDELFSKPPYALDRRTFPGAVPLLVIFERSDCPSCDIFHAEVLQQESVRKMLSGFEVVQLDMDDGATPVLTPTGRKLTAAQWADRLGVSYAPSFVYFDEAGNEVLRLDSATHYHRMVGASQYVLEKAYRREPILIRWLREQEN